MDPGAIREQIITLHPDWYVRSETFGKVVSVYIVVAEVLTFAMEVSERDGIGVGEVSSGLEDLFSGYDKVVAELDEAIKFVEQKVATTSDQTIKKLRDEAKQRKVDETRYGGVMSIRDQIDAIHPGWVRTVGLFNKMYFACVVIHAQMFDIKLDPRSNIAVREYGEEDKAINSKLRADRDYDVTVETLNEALAYIEKQLISK